MSTPRTSIAFHTMGCKTNFSETSTISSEMLSHGYKKVSYKDKADIYVLNTCSVKAGFAKLHIVKKANHEKN